MLLERDSELGLAEAFLDRVRGGEGGIMVLEGPPGIGKTALLSELDERSEGRGIEVLQARASQLDHGFSFGVARQLLERRVRAAAPAEREALLGGAAKDAAPALCRGGTARVDTPQGGLPLLLAEPIEETTLCDTRIPAGTRLLLLLRHASITAASRSDEFCPERWLEDSDETRAPKTLAFGAGPRFCPGRNLAFLEAKAAIATICRGFEWELDPAAGPVREAFKFAMVPEGLRVRLRERSQVRN